jgi:NADP-reducing hydrogenase subunit HndB
MTKRLNSLEDLNKLRETSRREIDLRQGAKDTRVTVHLGTCGIAAGARDILATLLGEIAAAKMSQVSVRQAGCAGVCNQEPMITVEDKAGQTWRYGKLDKGITKEIVQRHLSKGQPVKERLF